VDEHENITRPSSSEFRKSSTTRRVLQITVLLALIAAAAYIYLVTEPRINPFKKGGVAQNRPWPLPSIGQANQTTTSPPPSQKAPSAVNPFVARSVLLSDGSLLLPSAELKYADVVNSGFPQPATDQLIEQLRQALASQPSDAEEHYRLGLALAGKGSLNEAVAELTKARQLDPKVDVSGALGTTLYLMGDTSNALQELQSAIEKDQTDSVSHNNLGVVFDSADEPERAIAQFRLAADLAGGRPVPYLNLSLALAQIGRQPEANRYAMRACETGGYSYCPSKRERTIGHDAAASPK
jgi:tetratricopeptide (TPR) repeat protein